MATHTITVTLDPDGKAVCSPGETKVDDAETVLWQAANGVSNLLIFFPNDSPFSNPEPIGVGVSTVKTGIPSKHFFPQISVNGMLRLTQGDIVHL
jgi:hypothetical protein